MSRSYAKEFTEEKTLGSGTYGQVVLARRKKDDTQVAVKMIKRLDGAHKTDAIKEVLLMSRVHHPNIVQYLDSFMEGDTVYIVMEYCEEGNLHTLMDKSKEKLSQASIMNYFVQICLALKHLHAHSILHRDIKSENVFVARRGVLKLGDFGVARSLKKKLAQTQIGTPAYIAPEVIKGDAYNGKCDIWSLGVLLYEMATGGKMPFTPGTADNGLKGLWRKIKKDSPRHMKGVSPELRSLILHMLKKKPKKRPNIDGILRHPLVRHAFEGLPNRRVFSIWGSFMDKDKQTKARIKGEADARVLSNGIAKLNDGTVVSSSSSSSSSSASHSHSRSGSSASSQSSSSSSFGASSV